MKKLFLIALLMVFLPMFINAQDNAVQENIKSEVNNYINKGSYSMQELNSTLLQEYGIQNIEFVKLENGKYIPVREDQIKKGFGDKGEETQISSDVILIFAIIGAVLVALILLRSL